MWIAILECTLQFLLGVVCTKQAVDIFTIPPPPANTKSKQTEPENVPASSPPYHQILGTMPDFCRNLMLLLARSARTSLGRRWDRMGMSPIRREDRIASSLGQLLATLSSCFQKHGVDLKNVFLLCEHRNMLHMGTTSKEIKN